jgi:pimeloyl-ACP methyl ester carboxylesterase
MKRHFAILLLFICSPLFAQDADWQKFDAALQFLRGRNARDTRITSEHGIDEGRYVRIGGIEQWITIRGEDVRNPVILFLHGGPGDATNPWGYAAFRSWLRDFTVVQWDQRGAGRTLGKNGPSIGDTITLERMTQDGIELAELLRHELHQKKLILLGHSFGSVLGIFMIRARPDLFSAFVGTGQVGDTAAHASTVAWHAMLAHARRIGNQQAIRELDGAGPPPFAVQHKWANDFERADRFLASALGFALTAPGGTLRDINDWFDGQLLSGDHLVPELKKLDRKTLTGTFAVPVIVIQGADDFTTPTALAKQWEESIHAPHKQFVTIPGGHFAMFVNEEEFRRELVARVLPLVKD